MSNAWEMAAQDPLLDSFAEVIEGGHAEILDNEERGCGHLQHNAAYVRSDVRYFSAEDGTVPRWVSLDEPVEYREYSERGAIIPGWERFPGFEFASAYINSGGGTTPDGAIADHHNRMADRLRFDGDHYGEITVARAHDILMSVGKSHWQTPEEYAQECREQGLNLKIGVGPSSDPPTINPMMTRCWIVHPNGRNEGRAAIIGYAVLTRTVYTTGEDVTEDDPDIPAYAQEWYESGKVDLATPGPERDKSERPEGDVRNYGDDD